MKVKLEISDIEDLVQLMGILGFYGHKVWREDLGIGRNIEHYLIIEIDKSCIAK